MPCNPVSDIVIHADVRFVYVSWVNPNISTIFREIALQFNSWLYYTVYLSQQYISSALL